MPLILYYLLWFVFGPLLVAPAYAWDYLWPRLKDRFIGRLVIWLPFATVVFLYLFGFKEEIRNAINWCIPVSSIGKFLFSWFFMGTILSTFFLGPVHILLKDLVLLLLRGSRPNSHGTAVWGTDEEAKNSGSLIEKGHVGGFMLGRTGKRFDDFDPRYRVYRHVLTCAPTGSGKGVGCVIPNLLEYPGSVFCLDIKGENFAVTARSRKLLGPVLPIDPFGVTGQPSVSVNWLDWIDVKDPESVADAASLAETLVVKGINKENNYWDDSAANLLQGLILHVATMPEKDRNPCTVRKMLTFPEKKLRGLMEELGENEDLAHGIPSRTANMFLAKSDRDRSGVLSTAQQHTAFLDDPRIAQTLKSSELDFRDMKKEVLSTYLVVPPDKIHAYARYTRATIGLALKAMVKSKVKPESKVLFLLDEMASLGRFSSIEEGISILRGYDVCLWLLIQDLSQLEAVYPKWRSFLANSALQFFGTQDQQTAKYISEALGMETIQVQSTNQGSSSGPGGGSSSSGTSIQNHGRALMMPDEVRRLASSKVIVLEQGKSPQILTRLDYLRDEEFKGYFDENPMYLPASEAG